MYSIVLMMALSGSGDTAQAGLFHHRCSGGDCGGGYVACSGGYGGYGCTGYAAGCCGGGHHHRLFGHHRGHGCHGDYGCHGGYGYGCHGGYAGYSCTGGAYGGFGCTGGYGGYGGYMGCAGGYMMAPPAGMAPMPATGKAPEGGKTEKAPAPKPKEQGSVSAPATIVVSLPAEAKLAVDGVATQSTSGTRVFATPALDRGNEYFYTLTAEIARNGKTVSTSKKVAVRAGEETRVSLEFPSAETVAQR